MWEVLFFQEKTFKLGLKQFLFDCRFLGASGYYIYIYTYVCVYMKSLLFRISIIELDGIQTVLRVGFFFMKNTLLLSIRQFPHDWVEFHPHSLYTLNNQGPGLFPLDSHDTQRRHRRRHLTRHLILWNRHHHRHGRGQGEPAKIEGKHGGKAP